MRSNVIPESLYQQLAGFEAKKVYMSRVKKESEIIPDEENNNTNVPVPVDTNIEAPDIDNISINPEANPEIELYIESENEDIVVKSDIESDEANSK